MSQHLDRKLTDKEIIDILDRAGFPKHLSVGQMITIAYWSMFGRGKLNSFCNNLDRGMSVYYAFKYTKK